jgi:hypothetical protein
LYEKRLKTYYSMGYLEVKEGIASIQTSEMKEKLEQKTCQLITGLEPLDIPLDSSKGSLSK